MQKNIMIPVWYNKRWGKNRLYLYCEKFLQKRKKITAEYQKNTILITVVRNWEVDRQPPVSDRNSKISF